MLRLWWGGEAAGVCCPAAAGGGHWLLVGSEPLPEAVIGCGQGYSATAWFQSDHPGKQGRQPRGKGSYAGPYMNQA